MIKIFLTLIFTICYFSSAVVAQNTKIQGYIESAKNNRINLKVEIFDDQHFQQPKEYNILTSNGYFELSLRLSKSAVLGISERDDKVFNRILTTIDPGDSLVIHNRSEFPRKYALFSGLFESTFTGKGSGKSIFLKECNLQYVDFSKSLKQFHQMNLKEHLFQDLKLLRFMDSVFNSNSSLVSKSFLARQKVIFNMSILDGSFLRLMKENPSDVGIKDIYSNFMSTPIVWNTLNSDNIIYASPYMLNDLALMRFAFKNKISVADKGIGRDDPQRFYSMILECYKTQPVVRDLVLSHFLSYYIQSMGITLESQPLVNRYLADVNPKNLLRAQVKEKFNSILSNMAKGTPFLNFALQDTTGKVVKLSDFKGKVVVIDFFFNGCSGCQQMVPSMEELERKFSGQQVVFLSISIDATKAKWKDGIGKFSSSASLQLYTNGEGFRHPVIEFAAIKAYPALFVLDKEGRFLTRNLDPRTEKGKTDLYALIESQLAEKLK